MQDAVRLSLNPGDVIVVRHRCKLRQPDIDAIRQKFGSVPNEVVVLDGGVDLAVLGLDRAQVQATQRVGAGQISGSSEPRPRRSRAGIFLDS